MKLRFYVDLWPGCDPSKWSTNATTQPGAKLKGYKRVAFDVTIPDSAIFDVDSEAPEVGTPKLV